MVQVLRGKPRLQDQLESKVKKKTKKPVPDIWNPKDPNVLWLHTGSVLLNIRCSGGNPYGGYRMGRIISVIGDSNAGKTILVLTGLAHATVDPKFDNYRMIMDDAEEADSFDHEELFGKKFAKRIEPPSFDENGEPQNSETVEMFSDHIHGACDAALQPDGKPFIYILDSLDSIDSDKDMQLELLNRKARQDGNLSKVKDSFQTAKQKFMSKFFRQIRTKLKKSNSFLIIICQTRDNLNAMSFQKQTVAGGRARKFYSSIEMWLAHRQEITKTVDGIKYPIGVESLIKLTKNKFTGIKGNSPLIIYPSHGVDDLTSCIEYLIDVKHWKKPQNKIKAPEFGLDATLPKIIEFIEAKKETREAKLFQIVAKVYLGITEKLKVPRKKKFE